MVEADVCMFEPYAARDWTIGLVPFSGSVLPSSLAPTLAEALSDAPRPDSDFEALLSTLGILLPSSHWIQRFATEATKSSLNLNLKTGIGML
jgi:hypothetical protein